MTLLKCPECDLIFEDVTTHLINDHSKIEKSYTLPPQKTMVWDNIKNIMECVKMMARELSSKDKKIVEVVSEQNQSLQMDEEMVEVQKVKEAEVHIRQEIDELRKSRPITLSNVQPSLIELKDEKIVVSEMPKKDALIPQQNIIPKETIDTSQQQILTLKGVKADPSDIGIIISELATAQNCRLFSVQYKLYTEFDIALVVQKGFLHRIIHTIETNKIIQSVEQILLG